ncbi:YIP1 family protein [Palleronia sp. KMU-117]|uniref:YIP1 family protein n=1 Tax=Palleronia sp. KMU-117 TaxID=3434108 RepID=UPI003D71D6D3
MSVTRDIARTYRAPREVLRRRVAGAPREDRALAVVMAGCVLMFVAQWPLLSRLAFEDPSVALDMRLGGALLGWVFIAPLALYLLAAAVHGVLRLFGGRANWYEARMALFWALLASTPLWLLNGLVAGFIGPGAGQTIVGGLALLAFLGFWGAGLWEIETGHGAEQAATTEPGRGRAT